jgi:hypothetical protein
MFKKWVWGGVDWIDVFKDWVRWPAVVNKAMNLPVS